MEYIDTLMQYVRCFQTPPEESHFPNPNFLHPYKKKFNELTLCLEHLDKGDFMEYC